MSYNLNTLKVLICLNILTLGSCSSKKSKNIRSNNIVGLENIGQNESSDDSSNASQRPINEDEAIKLSDFRTLSISEMDHIFRTTFGLRSNLAHKNIQLAMEHARFDTEFSRLQIQEATFTQLEFLSTAVTEELALDGGFIDGSILNDCGEVTCATDNIYAVAINLFRHTQVEGLKAEIKAFLEAANLVNEGDLKDATTMLFKSLLLDPRFLYKFHKIDNSNISTINKISFAVIGRGPSEDIYASYSGKDMSDQKTQLQLIDELMNTDLFDDQVNSFHAQWLGYSDFMYKGIGVENSLFREVGKLVGDSLAYENKPWASVFVANRRFLDPIIAENYGITYAGPETGEYIETSNYGLLSSGAVLSVGARKNASITGRGIMVADHLLCKPIPPPGPNIDIDTVPGVEQNACNVDRSLALQDPEVVCAACHRKSDKIGMGLYGFDQQGRMQTHEEERPECPIVPNGELPDGTKFKGPAELSTALVNSSDFQSCAVEKLYTFLTGDHKAAKEKVELFLEISKANFAGKQTFRELYKKLLLDYLNTEV